MKVKGHEISLRIIFLYLSPFLMYPAAGIFNKHFDANDFKAGANAFIECLQEEGSRAAEEQRGNPKKCHDWEFVNSVYLKGERR